MRTTIFAQLASVIIRESFGEIVTAVVAFLLKRQKVTLRLICTETKISLKQVKLALAIGICHNIVSFSLHKRGFVEYSADCRAVLMRIRYPFYIHTAKQLYGDIAEVLVEELLLHGQLQISSLKERSLARLNIALEGGQRASFDHLDEKLDELKKAGFLEVCAYQNEADQYITTSAEQTDPPPSKKAKIDRPILDANFVKVNLNRFNLYLRDMEIINCVSNKLGEVPAQIIRAMLRLSEVKSEPSAVESCIVSANEIFAALPKDLGLKKPLLDLHLTVLADDQLGVISKAGDSGGGSYIINFSRVTESICKGNIESLVQERFGSKSLRIFRLLLLKQHLEQKQLEEMAMVPAKEAKELLYTMFGQGFITTTEIAKTADHAPSRTFFCFRVDVEALSRMALEFNYKAIFNCISRRLHTVSEHRRVLDKQQRVDAIIASLEQAGADQQKQEVGEMITPAERLVLQTVKKQMAKLENAELQLVPSILVLDFHLQYCAQRRL